LQIKTSVLRHPDYSLAGLTWR